MSAVLIIGASSAIGGASAKTDSALSAPFQRNLLHSPAQTADHLAGVALQLSAEQSGLLLNWDGRVLSF